LEVIVPNNFFGYKRACKYAIGYKKGQKYGYETKIKSTQKTTFPVKGMQAYKNA
jgi:hypothetical protein